MKRKCAALAFAILVGSFFNASRSAFGALTFDITGVITDPTFSIPTQATWDGVPIPAGTPASMHASIGLDAMLLPSADPRSDIYYDTTGSVTVTVGEHSVTLPGCFALVVDNEDGSIYSDIIRFYVSVSGPNGLSYNAGAVLSAPSTMLTGQSLMTTLTANNAGWGSEFYLFTRSPDGSDGGRAFDTIEITNVAAAIPEPSSIYLLGFGIFSGLRRRR